MCRSIAQLMLHLCSCILTQMDHRGGEGIWSHLPMGHMVREYCEGELRALPKAVSASVRLQVPGTAAESWLSRTSWGTSPSPTAAETHAKKMQLEEFEALQVKVCSSDLKDNFSPKHWVRLTLLFAASPHHNTGRRKVSCDGSGKG